MLDAEISRALLYESLDFISNAEIKHFTRKVLDDADDAFWRAASSSSGANHPPENNNLSKNEFGIVFGKYGEGGLARHSVKVAFLGYTIGYHLISDKNLLDTIVSSCILHDIKKRGVDGTKDYDPNHPLLAVEFIDKYRLAGYFKEKIQEGIRYHMNNLTVPEAERAKALSIKLPLEYRIVQIADIVASRKSLSFFPGVFLEPQMLDKVNIANIEEIMLYEKNQEVFHRTKKNHN